MNLLDLEDLFDTRSLMTFFSNDDLSLYFVVYEISKVPSITMKIFAASEFYATTRLLCK